MSTPEITGLDYWMGRDSRYRVEWTEDIKLAANDLLIRVNRLLALMTGVDFEVHPVTRSIVSSGWRPPAVNASTPGAAPNSKHMTGHAVDIYDPDGDLKAWCWEHQEALSRLDIDLYMEHPASTKGWLHLQSIPPASQKKFPLNARKRWFYP